MHQIVAADIDEQLLDFGVQREESVRPDIEPVAVLLDRARQPADPVQPLQHQGLGTALHRFEGGRHPGRPTADDDQALPRPLVTVQSLTLRIAASAAGATAAGECRG